MLTLFSESPIVFLGYSFVDVFHDFFPCAYSEPEIFYTQFPFKSDHKNLLYFPIPKFPKTDFYSALIFNALIF